MAYANLFQKKIYYSSPSLFKNIITSIYGYKQKKKRHGKFYHEYMNYLSRSQWFNNRALEDIQFLETKNFLIHAKNNCLFYKNLFKKHEFVPEKIESLDDLKKLSKINKKVVKDNIYKILPQNINDYNEIWVRTSGTTGHALHFPLSRLCFEREYAFIYLHFFWAGIKRGDKIAICAGHPVTKYDQESPPFWSYDYSNKWLLFSSYHLKERNLSFYILELEKYKPDLLKGYPSSIYLLALANKNLGSRIKPKAIITSAETLFDYQRKAIEDSFSCKVFDWYGNAEKGANIVECEKGNYHLKMEYSYVEFLDENDKPVPDGNESRMVCTTFGNYAMPLIRYDVGDVVVPSKKKSCECGRGGKIIEKIVGRTDDYILTPDGRYVGRLSQLFNGTLNVQLAQIVQNKIDEIIIHIVKERRYTKRDEDTILKEARFRLGSEIKIKFEYVREIPRGKGGKHNFVISNIKKKKFFM